MQGTTDPPKVRKTSSILSRRATDFYVSTPEKSSAKLKTRSCNHANDGNEISGAVLHRHVRSVGQRGSSHRNERRSHDHEAPSSRSIHLTRHRRYSRDRREKISAHAEAIQRSAVYLENIQISNHRRQRCSSGWRHADHHLEHGHHQVSATQASATSAIYATIATCTSKVVLH